MLVESGAINSIQRSDRNLRAVYRCVKNEVPSTKWPPNISNFRRYRGKLSISEGVLLYDGAAVVSIGVVTDIILALHSNFAHVGRDKMVDLMRELVWHPSKLKIISDVCSTCLICQLIKDYPI